MLTFKKINEKHMENTVKKKDCGTDYELNKNYFKCNFHVSADGDRCTYVGSLCAVNDHSAIHTGVYLYSCRACTLYFNERCDFNEHLKRRKCKREDLYLLENNDIDEEFHRKARNISITQISKEEYIETVRSNHVKYSKTVLAYGDRKPPYETARLAPYPEFKRSDEFADAAVTRSRSVGPGRTPRYLEEPVVEPRNHHLENQRAREVSQKRPTDSSSPENGLQPPDYHPDRKRTRLENPASRQLSDYIQHDRIHLSICHSEFLPVKECSYLIPGESSNLQTPESPVHQDSRRESVEQLGSVTDRSTSSSSSSSQMSPEMRKVLERVLNFGMEEEAQNVVQDHPAPTQQAPVNCSAPALAPPQPEVAAQNLPTQLIYFHCPIPVGTQEPATAHLPPFHPLRILGRAQQMVPNEQPRYGPPVLAPAPETVSATAVPQLYPPATTAPPPPPTTSFVFTTHHPPAGYDPTTIPPPTTFHFQFFGYPPPPPPPPAAPPVLPSLVQNGTIQHSKNPQGTAPRPTSPEPVPPLAQASYYVPNHVPSTPQHRSLPPTNSPQYAHFPDADSEIAESTDNERSDPAWSPNQERRRRSRSRSARNTPRRRNKSRSNYEDDFPYSPPRGDAPRFRRVYRTRSRSRHRESSPESPVQDDDQRGMPVDSQQQDEDPRGPRPMSIEPSEDQELEEPEYVDDPFGSRPMSVERSLSPVEIVEQGLVQPSRDIPINPFGSSPLSDFAETTQPTPSPEPWRSYYDHPSPVPSPSPSLSQRDQRSSQASESFPGRNGLAFQRPDVFLKSANANLLHRSTSTDSNGSRNSTRNLDIRSGGTSRAYNANTYRQGNLQNHPGQYYQVHQAQRNDQK